ncbi:MAG: hypothetical protein ACREVX_09425 [Clostridium sp.]|uniref:hypothetical protein n=1 Tax=Clostridium sp. TaxID=1506 RepID=UPI003D6CCD3C
MVGYYPATLVNKDIDDYIECDNKEKLWNNDRTAFYKDKDRMMGLSIISGMKLEDIEKCK